MFYSVTDTDDGGNSIEPVDKDFVSAACWIQGLYIYREMKDRAKDAAYYGIPRDIGMNGVTAKGTLCRTVDQEGNKMPLSECQPMSKTFFLQVHDRFAYFEGQSNKFLFCFRLLVNIILQQGSSSPLSTLYLNSVTNHF